MKNISFRLLETLKKNQADFFVSLPCKLLKEFILLLENDVDIIHVPVTREEEGIGICVGAYLGGKTPVMVIQNSGIGNSVNVLCSLAIYYKIPILMIISHRGTVGEKSGAQVPMGLAVKEVLEAINIPVFEFKQSEYVDKIGELVSYAKLAESPVAALMGATFWGDSE